MKDIISKEDRLQAIKLGFIFKLAENGVKLSDTDALVKRAWSEVINPANLMKATLTVSVLFGLPIGIASHLISKYVKSNRRKEKELRTTIDFYRNAAQQLEGRLAED